MWYCTARRTTTCFLVRPHSDVRSNRKLTLHRTSFRPAPLCRSLRPMELCATPSGLGSQVQPRMVGLLDGLHPRAFRELSFPQCMRSVLTSQLTLLSLTRRTLFIAHVPLSSLARLLAAQWAQASNFYTHLTLRSLRPEGTKKRSIPTGYGFDWAFCANYLFESLVWIGTTFMTGSVSCAFYFLILRSDFQQKLTFASAFCSFAVRQARSSPPSRLDRWSFGRSKRRAPTRRSLGRTRRSPRAGRPSSQASSEPEYGKVIWAKDQGRGWARKGGREGGRVPKGFRARISS